MEFWAFELKINNWKRALFQALRYKTFASRIMIVFPMNKEKLIAKNVDKFNKLKLGIMLFNAYDKSYKILVRPPKTHPSSRMHHLFMLTKILSKSID